MSDVIWSPSTNHNSGPGVSVGIGNAPYYDGGTTPETSKATISPVVSGSTNLKNKYEDDNIRNLKTSSAFDYMDYLEDALRLNDLQLSKYFSYNKEMYEDLKKFETEMSNTAIQRQVKDLISAGLNPVLAANYGGASVPSISAPYSSISPSSAFGNVINGAASMSNALMSRASAWDVASLNSQTTLTNTGMITEREYKLAEMANSNAILIHQLDNDARHVLETNLQNARFKHDFDKLDAEFSQWVLKNNAGDTKTLPGLVQHISATFGDILNNFGASAFNSVADLMHIKYRMDYTNMSQFVGYYS